MFQNHIFILGLDAGLVGVSMTYAIEIMNIFQWTVRQSTMVENQVFITSA